MGNIRQPDRITSPISPANGNGYGLSNGADAMSAFYAEVCAPFAQGSQSG